MTLEDETKPKEESKEDLKSDIKKTENASTGPAKIRTQYTYERLLSFRHSPHVKQRPGCLSEEYCNEEGTWDPELWHASLSGKKSRPSSPAGIAELKLTRKTSDAKERIKQEQDGIILSPQRRSFGHGCQITFPQQQSSLASERPRPKSPLDRDPRDSQDIPNGRVIAGRRRVITRPSRESLLEKERERRERDNGAYEDREVKDRYQRRSSYDRQTRRRKDDQPEWFVDTPTSQLETIELHGFGEEEEAERQEVNSDLRKEKGARKQEPSELDNLVASLDRGGQPESTTMNKEFDINDFFNFSDPVSIATPIEVEEEGLAKSRFSHFFSSNGPVADGRSSLGSSRRSSLQKDELEFLQELRSGHSGSESAGSTPIHALINDTPESTPFTLLEMLQKGTGQDSIDVENDMRKREVQQKLMEGQAKSLAEIEAELQKESKRPGTGSVIVRGGSPAEVGEEGDQTAFNNFLAIIRPSKPLEIRRDIRESPDPVSAPRESSPQASTGLQSPFGPGQANHMFDPFKDTEGRMASFQSPDVPLDNELNFRTLPQELNQQQNRLGSPLEKGTLLDLLKVSASQSAPQNAEPDFHNRQSPLLPEQLSNILQQQQQQQQIPTSNHNQVLQNHQDVLANLVKQAVATNPAVVQSVLSQGLGHSEDPGSKNQRRSMSPQELYQHVLMQQQQQQQQASQRGRSPLVTSPLALGGTQSPLTHSPHHGGITSPLGTVGQHLIPPPPMGVAIPPGAHQPSPIRPRIPSPQELVKHTQNILQQALIKRQLEVQREKFYARERETKNRSPVPVAPNQMGQRKVVSGGRTPPVTPVTKPSQTLTTAFTPTSVIRKMHESKAEAKASEARQPGPTDHSQPTNGPLSDASPSYIPQAQGSPSRQPASDGFQSLGGYSSPMKGTEQGFPRQRVGPPASHSTPQRAGQPNPASPGQANLGQGDATEGAKETPLQMNQVQNITKNSAAPLDSKAVTANGDMAGSKHLPNHQPGFTLHSPPGSSHQQLDLIGRESNDAIPDQGMLPPSQVHHAPLGGPSQSYTGGVTPDQFRPMVRMPNQQHQQQPPPTSLRQPQTTAPVPQPSPMMQARPPMNQQYPMMQPNQRMAMGSTMGMNPMAQQNLMRGMIFQPRPQMPAVNPMALLAMQRAAMSQMQIPPPPAQSATSPTQGGLTRGMLATHFNSQQVLHHHGAAMGMSMVNPRNLTPTHPQMTPQTRLPIHQHGTTNDIASAMEHQRNFSHMFPMSSAPATSTNTSVVSPDTGHNPLAKWFGKDLLKQSHSANQSGVPEGLKVLSVEELERQQHQQAVS